MPEEKKVCPLLSIEDVSLESSVIFESCRKGDCEWWYKDESEERCAIRQIAIELGRLANK